MKRLASKARKRKTKSLPVEFYVKGAAVSFQTKQRQVLRAWKMEVRFSAMQQWAGSPVDGRVHVKIKYFCDQGRSDYDNLNKPIVDALQGVIYKNDRQVVCTPEPFDPSTLIVMDRDQKTCVCISEPMAQGLEFVMVRVEAGRERRLDR